MTNISPAPPTSRNPKDTGSEPKAKREDKKPNDRQRSNLAEQGRQGNIKQNTTNQGYQQDR
jgi:hypothetical protein